MSKKTFVASLAVATLVLGTWAWAQQSGQGQQPMGPMGQGGMMGQQGGMGMGPGMMGGRPGPGMGPGMMMGASLFERPLISEILSAKDQLVLTADQEKKLRGLRSDFEKEAIRREAEIRAAEVDLRELLAAEPPDLGKGEVQVKKIAALQGELRFSRIKVLQEGRAVLTKEQWQKFEALARRPGPMGPGGGQDRRGQPGPGTGPGMMMGPGMMGGGMMQGQPGMHGMPGMMMGGQQAPAGGANGAIRTDATGPVTVVATLLPSRGDRVAFEVKLDTHSIELDSYKPEAAVTLRNDRGESAPAVVESPSGSGHHRAVTLAFPASLAAGAKNIELVVRDLGGVNERILRWESPFAGR